ncbi:hypothetical protein LPB140_01500 [Sphingorhabdus lutea]|uniref:TolC family outer membrane protein n=1 Tax=Sphingorhabdus lutea TaxID=1913578 RepID=A0A1L3J999_9SPHN|nr:TolC family outer membrane protein [Sphingorhabdus lutea]APG61722.1 hypothetical protein LPB140_01500 [Sphingorhabdus lutea]
MALNIKSQLWGSAFILTAAALTLPIHAETLQQALQSAYDSNPNLTAARAGQEALNENVPLARSSGRPSASIQPTFTENVVTSGGAFAQARSFSAVGSVSVPLYQGGAVKNAVRGAENRVEAGFASLRGTESAIFSAVVGAYMDVIRDEAIVELNRAQAGTLQVNLEATKDRFEIGDVTRTDVAQSESRYSLALANLETARANLIRSKEIYIQLVGNEPGDLEAPPPLPNLPESADMAVDIAVEHNPDLIAAKEQVEASRYDRKAAEAGRLPTVSAFSQSRYNNALNSLSTQASAFSPNATFDNSIGIRATIPIYQGGAPSAQIRQAQARISQAQELEIAAEREVIAQTRAAFSSWRATQQVIMASQRAVEASQLSLEGVRIENSVGNRTILDILNAEQELVAAKSQLIAARRNNYVAGFTLLAAMGRAEARDLGIDGGPLYDPVANYNDVKNQWNDWSSVPSTQPKATRTTNSNAQSADIEAFPDYSRR